MKVFKLFFIAFFTLSSNAAEPTLRQKVSQMIIVGFDGKSTKDASVRAMLSDAGYGRFGGVMLLSRNVQDKAQLTALNTAIKAKQPKIFIAIDEEGGNVTRMKDVSFGSAYPSAREVASSLNINQAAELYVKMAQSLAQIGVNLNFAPVVDLHDDDSPIIGARGRAFSENASKVIFYADVFIRAFAQNNIMTTLKHFPGHGNSRQDSHKQKSIVNIDRNALLPYREMSHRADMIMVGHLCVKDVDESNPATLSKAVISGILRDELGYNGVVISDDMLMLGAGDEPLKQKIIKFINAGGDILLFSEFKIGDRRTADIVTQHIIDAISEKKISRERIDISYKRIKMLKDKYIK
ncbi:glycoside hydrolase family 3 protein [Campylobacter sp. faydin G-105]|uniref:glycoside hydrolase family 3 protein n=1 Tax=Campylobacter anatolicus TaxID=2829105 RepID=UPI001B916481|nr:glycoside hydrolase family 3 protein [Campylobacter anatolicus]MBR8462762.1 glycoside hydrolase family 3 protein [Campylobacter anatolicus]